MFFAHKCRHILARPRSDLPDLYPHPAAGFFHWSPDRLLHKTTKQQGPGWLLGGFVQNLEDQPYVYGVTKLHVVKAPGDGSGADGVSNVTAAKGTAGGGGGGLKGLAAGLEGLALSSDAARIAANMNAKRRQRLLLDAKSANVGAGVKGGEAATERQGQQNGRQAQQQQQPLAPPLVALGGGVRPAFLHRTMDKFAVGEAPHLMEVLTAPMTQRCAASAPAHACVHVCAMCTVQCTGLPSVRHPNPTRP